MNKIFHLRTPIPLSFTITWVVQLCWPPLPMTLGTVNCPRVPFWFWLTDVRKKVRLPIAIILEFPSIFPLIIPIYLLKFSFAKHLPNLLGQKLFLTNWLPRRACFYHTTAWDWFVQFVEQHLQGTAPPGDREIQVELPNEMLPLHSKTLLQCYMVPWAAPGILPVKKF